MISFNPTQLEAWTGGRWTTSPVASLTGFTIDTRQLRAGQVFVALKTAQRDGHDFLEVAREAGASGAVVSKEQPDVDLPQLVVPNPLIAFQAIARQHRQNFAGPVIGISGSVGKTSTKDLLAALLGGVEAGVLATLGNLNNHLGVPLTLTKLDTDQHKFAVIEAGISGPGEMAPLASMIEPDLAIITLVAPAHIEELGSLEGVAREKAILPQAVRREGVAVYPTQCETFEAFSEAQVSRIVVERADAIRPEEAPADRVFYTITHREEETAIAIAYGQPPPLVFTMRRISDGMAQNAVLAICAALRLGVAFELVRERIREWSPANLRGELRQIDDKQVYVDCYNANPASMSDALEVFCTTTSNQHPRLFVLGGMEELGDDSESYHHELGLSLKLGPADQVYMIGGQSAAIRSGALEAGLSKEQLTVIEEIEIVRSVFENFSGPVFLKGSRRYRLETLLPETKPEAAHA